MASSCGCAGPGQPVLEMTEIQTRLLAEGGPAVLFENVVGADGKRHDMPVLVNLFGTVERVAHGAWSAAPDQLREVGETLAFLRSPSRRAAGAKPLDLLPLVKTVHDDEAQDRVERALPGDRLDAATTSIWRKLPIQTCWPGEPAPLITWPLVVTQGPNPGARGQLQSRHLSHAGAGQEHRPSCAG